MISLTALRAFEDGVLHEMGEAVLVGQLVARAGLHHQHQMGDFASFFLVYQSNAVWKDGFFIVHELVECFVFQHHCQNWAAKIRQFED